MKAHGETIYNSKKRMSISTPKFNVENPNEKNNGIPQTPEQLHYEWIYKMLFLTYRGCYNTLVWPQPKSQILCLCRRGD